MITAAFVYFLCALMALICAALFFRAYMRSRTRILFWGGLCFSGITLSNLLLVFDRVLFPDIELSTWRLITALIALLPLLYGLIWEGE